MEILDFVYIPIFSDECIGNSFSAIDLNFQNQFTVNGIISNAISSIENDIDILSDDLSALTDYVNAINNAVSDIQDFLEQTTLSTIDVSSISIEDLTYGFYYRLFYPGTVEIQFNDALTVPLGAEISFELTSATDIMLSLDSQTQIIGDIVDFVSGDVLLLKNVDEFVWKLI